MDQNKMNKDIGDLTAKLELKYMPIKVKIKKIEDDFAPELKEMDKKELEDEIKYYSEEEKVFLKDPYFFLGEVYKNPEITKDTFYWMIFFIMPYAIIHDSLHSTAELIEARRKNNKDLYKVFDSSYTDAYRDFFKEEKKIDDFLTKLSEKINNKECIDYLKQRIISDFESYFHFQYIDTNIVDAHKLKSGRTDDEVNKEVHKCIFREFSKYAYSIVKLYIPLKEKKKLYLLEKLPKTNCYPARSRDLVDITVFIDCEKIEDFPPKLSAVENLNTFVLYLNDFLNNQKNEKEYNIPSNEQKEARKEFFIENISDSIYEGLCIKIKSMINLNKDTNTDDYYAPTKITKQGSENKVKVAVKIDKNTRSSFFLDINTEIIKKKINEQAPARKQLKKQNDKVKIDALDKEINDILKEQFNLNKMHNMQEIKTQYTEVFYRQWGDIYLSKKSYYEESNIEEYFNESYFKNLKNDINKKEKLTKIEKFNSDFLQNYEEWQKNTFIDKDNTFLFKDVLITYGADKKFLIENKDIIKRDDFKIASVDFIKMTIEKYITLFNKIKNMMPDKFENKDLNLYLDIIVNTIKKDTHYKLFFNNTEYIDKILNENNENKDNILYCFKYITKKDSDIKNILQAYFIEKIKNIEKIIENISNNTAMLPDIKKRTIIMNNNNIKKYQTLMNAFNEI